MMQNKPYIVIITGGIATGKSTVCNILRERGFKVVDSDKIVHEIYASNPDTVKEIVKAFGNSVINPNGKVDRKKLGEIVFSCEENLQIINRIVHTNVVTEINRKIDECKENLVFADIPLMLEEKDKLEKYGLKYDEICLVYAPVEIQMERLLKRDNRGYVNSKKIIDAQRDIEKKKKAADYVIENDGSLEQLEAEVGKYTEKLLQG